jgi:16S rRNA (cytosine1402-N4)-methyltransferase
LAAQGKARLINEKPMVPGEEEISRNPRARSAKLRAIVKII